MLKIRRTIERRKVKREAQTRGPFLTDGQERDGGWRRIVVTLHPMHMILRHFRGSRRYPLTYEKAINVARRDCHRQMGKIKAQHRSGA